MRFLRLSTFALALCALPAFAASTITGTITNGTNKKPSAGDTVTLIRLAQGMQEATHTTTDGKGHYSLVVPDDGIHLVRVTHEGANYFKPAPPGTESVDIDVFEAAANVKGVALEADVLRLQTSEDAKSLHVVQHFFLKNDSTPPRTQYSDKTFEFTLPEGAVIEGAAAQGPGGMTVQSQPTPLPTKNHYTFNFALRPGGATQFQVSYSVPYAGSLKLTPTTAMTTQNLVVMMPKAMKFDASAVWASIAEEPSAQTYVARNVTAASPEAITVSGQGQLPRQTATTDGTAAGADAAAGGAAAGGAAAGGAAAGGAAAGPEAAGTPVTTANDTRPGGGLGQPIDTPDPLSKYKYWILAGIVLVLAAGAGFLFSRPQNAVAVAAVPAAEGVAPVTASSPSALLSVLRDELFTLESDRLTGKITEEQYARVKPALEVVLQNALERGKAASGTTAA